MSAPDISGLDRLAEFAHLASLVPDCPPLSRALVAHGMVARLVAHAASRMDDRGRFVMREAALDAYIGVPGAVAALKSSGFLRRVHGEEFIVGVLK